VDHFIPSSRYPDDALDNFVVADKSCNGFKSSSPTSRQGLRGIGSQIEISRSPVQSTCAFQATQDCGFVKKSSFRRIRP